MKKILVGYDESPVSSKVVDLAIEHAKAFGAHIVLVTCLAGGTESDSEEIRKTEERLAAAKNTFIREGISCQTELLVRGVTPGEDLVAHAEEIGAYEIILGVKKRSKTGKLLFGSNAQYVILNADCSVVSIK
jgi:nucleotide-binding universal stress UspA family protein